MRSWRKGWSEEGIWSVMSANHLSAMESKILYAALPPLAPLNRISFKARYIALKHDYLLFLIVNIAATRMINLF